MLSRVIFVIAALTACSKPPPADPGPPCDKIMPHLAIVMKQGLTGHGAVEFGNQKADIVKCEARKLTPAQRRCLMATQTVEDISTCNAGTAPATPSGAPERTPRRLPAPSGSDVPPRSPE